jgi:hypothetical protein
MKTDRIIDTLLQEITELTAADQAELMQELMALYAESLGVDDDGE